MLTAKRGLEIGEVGVGNYYVCVCVCVRLVSTPRAPGRGGVCLALGVLDGVFAFLQLGDEDLRLGAVQPLEPHLVVVDGGDDGAGGRGGGRERGREGERKREPKDENHI